MDAEASSRSAIVASGEDKTPGVEPSSNLIFDYPPVLEQLWCLILSGLFCQWVFSLSLQQIYV